RRLSGADGKPDAAAGMTDEEKHIETTQQDRLNVEEVSSHDARRLRPQERSPARTAATWCRLQAGTREQPPDTARRNPEAELPKLAGDPPVTPTRVLPCQPQHQLPDLPRQRRPPCTASWLPPPPTHE